MMSEDLFNKLKIAFIAFVVLFIGGSILATPFYVYFTGGTEEIVVDDKERVCDGSDRSSCRYLIWTKENGVYKNTDTLLRLKFDSSDVYGKLEKGETYKIDYYGWRVPILSWYPNIYNTEEL